jgi:hypothetical protein
MSFPSCRVPQLSPALGLEMTPCVMPASLVGTFGCPFLAPLLEPFSPLTSYTVTFEPPLFRVSLVTSIIWSSSMTAHTTRGLFHCARSLTPSPPSPTSLPLCSRSLAAPSGAPNAIMDASLITPPALSFSLTASSFGCRVLDRLQLSAVAAPPTLSLVPTSVRSALTDPHWRHAMEEYEALLSNNTWDLVLRPPGANVVTGKWIFKRKLKPDGSLDRYKARWVLRGFTQRPGWTTMRPSAPLSSLPPSVLC